MDIITLFNQKGGVGKTTLSTTIAAGLAIRGKRVLLVDADAQGNAGQGLGFAAYPGLYNLMVREASFKECIRPVDPSRIVPPDDELTGGLWFIGSNSETQSIPANISGLDVFLNRMLELQDMDMIDVVVVDTPPTPTLLHGSLYMATDAVLIPTRLEAYSLTGVQATVGYWKQYNKMRKGYDMPPAALLGIVPVGTELGTTEHAENLRLLHTAHPGLVYRPMPKRILWSEAASAHKTIFAYYPDHPATQDAWTLIDRMLAYAAQS